MIENHKTSNGGRFAQLLSGQPPEHIWDTVLFESRSYLVSPTLGSIVPNWLLIVPKDFALNFADLKQSARSNPFRNVLETMDALDVGQDFIWFEHGAGNRHSEIGCGVDHAHIHVLPKARFSLAAFHSEVQSMSDASWDQRTSVEAYSDIQTGQDYYIFGDAHIAHRMVGKNLGRQFFRKIIANLSGQTTAWDYNEFHHVANVKATIDRYSKVLTLA